MSRDGNPTTTEAARAHCLQELAVVADEIAQRHLAAAAADKSGYQREFARVAFSIADRLRSSPGFRP